MILPSVKALRLLAKNCLLVDQNTGKVSSFIFNDEQEFIYKQLTKYSEDSFIVLKGRQVGLTTAMCLYDLALALLNERARIGIAVHDQKTAIDLISKIKIYCEDLGIKLAINNALKIKLENGSTITAISTSGGGKNGTSTVGRGITFDFLHVTELAFWSNKTAYTALLPCVAKGRIVIESTALGRDGVFDTLWYDDDSNFKKVFFSIEQHLGYTENPEKISEKDWVDLQGLGFSRRECAAWWLQTFQKSGKTKVDFLREYPVKPDQPFAMSSGRYFEEQPLVKLPTKEIKPCVISCDIAKGKGGDSTVLFVLSYEGECLDLWSSNQSDMFFVVQQLKDLVACYSPKAILVETNGVGEGYFEEFLKNGIPCTPIATDDKTKELGFQHVRRHLKSNKPVPAKVAEEVQYLRFENGKYKGKDDHLMAFAFALNYTINNPYKVRQQPNLLEQQLRKQGYR